MTETLSAPEAEFESLRARARALASEGYYREAVTLGQRISRGHSDTQLERDLIKWRHMAFYESHETHPRQDWPPKVSDPFSNLVEEIPEIGATSLNTDVMAGALLNHGSLIVRGLLSSQLAASLIADVDRAYDARASETDEKQSWYAPFETDNDPGLALSRGFSGDTSMLMSDSPHIFARWVDILHTCGALNAVSAYLAETPVVSAHKTRMYRIPSNPGAGWHQDGAFLGGAGARTVNLWVALSACGEDAPSLEVVPWRLNDIVQTGTHGAYFEWSVGNGKVDEMAQGHRLAFPRFAPGDAMLFDHLCLHRTGVRPGMTRGRYALETWMFAPSSYPDNAALVL